MVALSFSLTEKYVIDPVLTLRAPLPPSRDGSALGRSDILWQGVQAELMARIVAVVASIFALMDLFIHFTMGISQGEVGARFKQIAWFAQLVLAGSIAGVIWPDVFKCCCYCPPLPVQRGIPHALNALLDPNILSPEIIWAESSLEDKRDFVEALDSESSVNRERLAPIVYRAFHDQQVAWAVTDAPCFYHATSEKALESILKSGKVGVYYEKAFRGAFVSTRPAGEFGTCILAFKKNIERLSALEHGFVTDEGAYWAGFSHAIPVTQATLAYIICIDDSQLQGLQWRCSTWAGRTIEVLSVQADRQQRKGLRAPVVPSEWKDDGPEMAQRIQMTLRARAQEAAQEGGRQAQVLVC